MNINFKTAINNVEPYLTKNNILCIEQIYPILNCIEFQNLEIIILSIKNISQGDEEIIPSLTVCKKFNYDAKYVNSFNELWDFIYENSELGPSDNESKLLDDIINYAKNCGYELLKYKNYKTYILYKEPNRPTDKKNKRRLRRVASISYAIRERSQNLLNDSFHLADDNRMQLQKLFTPNLDSAVDTISQFINENYKVISFALQYNHIDKVWNCKKSCPVEVENITNEYIDKVGDEIKPVSGLYGSTYFIIFPFLSTLTKRDLHSAILLTSKAPIPTFIITNLRYFTNYYFAVYLEEKKSDILEQMQKATLGLYHYVEQIIDSGNEIDVYEQIIQFIAPAFNIAISATNAFSATLRLYDPKSESLKLIYEKSTGRVVKKDSQQKEKIPINQFDRSQVALSFKSSTPGDDGRYIADLNTLKLRKKTTYREHRLNSMCELCFCVFFKKTPFGVLNFESPQINGLHNDKKFLKQIRTSLENHITALFESNDKQWLARRSKIYQNLHEIKNIISYSSFPKSFSSLIEKYIDSNETVERNINNVKLYSIIEFKEQYIENYRRELINSVPFSSIRIEMIEEFSYGCKEGISDKNIMVAEYKMNLIKILYKNLLDNYRKWGNKEKDVVAVIHRRNSRNLEFYSKSSMLFNDADFNKLTIEPYSTGNNANRQAHYGMFIIGMLARHLGGYTYVFNKGDIGISQQQVIIPLNW